MDIVEAEELLDAMPAMVRRAPPSRPPAAGPSDAADRANFQRAPFVEADYGRARRALPIEAADAFFFRSKSGSEEVFHVRMRWAVRPSRRSRRRTHSSVTGGSSRRRRQYSASFGTDQVAKGKPRSPGFERATSTSSRSWRALRIGGRPRGLETCSKVVNPEALKRCTQSYAAVKWQRPPDALPIGVGVSLLPMSLRHRIQILTSQSNLHP